MKKLKQLILAALIIPLVSGCSYNKMVELREGVDAQWAQVQNVYQRRADLIPNLVSTVKGYAAHEQQTLEGVIEARSKATAVNLSVDEMNEQTLQQFQQAQEGLSSALSRLMVVVEKYPDLKANQNFLDLQAQLEGTENRITVERMKFNEATRSYNTTVSRFPTNLTAKIFSFEKKPYFEADQSAQKAPQVQF